MTSVYNKRREKLILELYREFEEASFSKLAFARVMRNVIGRDRRTINGYYEDLVADGYIIQTNKSAARLSDEILRNEGLLSSAEIVARILVPEAIQ